MLGNTHRLECEEFRSSMLFQKKQIPARSLPLPPFPLHAHADEPASFLGIARSGVPWPKAGTGAQMFLETFCLPGTCRISLGHECGQNIWTRGKALGDLPLTSQSAGLFLPGKCPSHLCSLCPFSLRWAVGFWFLRETVFLPLPPPPNQTLLSALQAALPIL